MKELLFVEVDNAPPCVQHSQNDVERELHGGQLFGYSGAYVVAFIGSTWG